MLNFLKNNWAVLLVFILCFWAVKALFLPGFFPVHDSTQIARLYGLDNALGDGQIPPRWVSSWGFGFGAPLFNFYSPFFYYLAEIFHKIGFSFINSTKAVLLSGFLLSALSMYLWARNHFGKIPSVFSSVIYTYAPYRALDVYVRGAFSEFFSFALIPAILLSYELLFKTGKLKYSILSGIFLGLLILTHNLTTLMFSVFFLIYLSYLYFKNKNRTGMLLLSILIAGGLSMYYWLPMIAEKSYTLVDKVNVGELFDYRLHFVYIRQFFDSPWGYGGSIYGLLDGISFEVGKANVLVAGLSLVIFIWGFYKKKFSPDFKIPLIIFLLFVLSLYFSSFHSKWIWERINFLSYLQFPWRFLLFSAVFSSFLGGFVISFIEKNFGKAKALILAIILGAVSITFTYFYFQPEKQLFVTDDYYINEEKIKWDVSNTSFEYLPKNVPTKISEIKTTQVDIKKGAVAKGPYKILKGQGHVNVISNKSHLKRFKIEATSPLSFQVNTFSFPGWTVELNGKVIDYKTNKLGLIVLDIPGGSHIAAVEFKNTFPRAAGNAVSLVTIFNLIGFGLFRIISGAFKVPLIRRP